MFAKVPDHDKASALRPERAEQGFFHPFGCLADAAVVLAQFVVVEVVDNNVVRSPVPVPETARGLATPTSEESYAVGSDKFALLLPALYFVPKSCV